MQPDAERAFEQMVARVDTTLDAVGEAFPYVAEPDTGAWTTTDDGNWCGGHWVGLLWLAHEYTGEDRFRTAAERATETVVASVEPRSMFYGMNANYCGFRAFDLTGEQRFREIGIDGADRTVDYFHQGARQVPLGTQPIEAPATNFRGPEADEGPSGDVLGAVDSVYTALPVLWRAYRETGDPTYRDTAVSHADRTLDWFVREDGRTWHHAEFDPETGELVRQYNELAYSDDTCWARGQGWAIAGLARAYDETGAERYLDALERTVGYYETHAPADLVPYWDFEHPDAPDVPRDTSAAGLAAYGLTRLDDSPETADLRETGDAILDSLVENYQTPTGAEDDRQPGMVIEGCYNGPAGYADANELVWTDYYVAVALANRAGVVSV
ncbi:unsaturated glucuronyl hydrolase [Salinarchaeum sp. Harcht-Bsk1]|uniref:glycoside hydrolase family 88 protein n=1 Tax=Salinarchaeum sp. Harcht-Bsk1 TaxID=1333523 RepID=UPI0003424963|nr:glycoside hydrolase family 88 protein [Salinarchaeum sp. Harcht-Bsk1]AGN01249.1 unsaturated glucuronyl hydrolase [Salinarchaeum sp. Harcht-Bsk1]